MNNNNNDKACIRTKCKNMSAKQKFVSLFLSFTCHCDSHSTCTKGVGAPANQWGIVGAGKDYSGLEWILVQLRIVSGSSRVKSKIAAQQGGV